jgi:hypothetical protein
MKPMFFSLLFSALHCQPGDGYPAIAGLCADVWNYLAHEWGYEFERRFEGIPVGILASIQAGIPMAIPTVIQNLLNSDRPIQSGRYGLIPILT